MMHRHAARRKLAILLLVASVTVTCCGECLKKPSIHPKPRKAEPITVPMRLLLAHAVTQVKPAFPASAMAAKIDGTVTIALEVDHQGHVATTLPLSGAAPLRLAAEEAVKQWQFDVFCVKGEPYTVRSVLQFQFRLRGDGSRQEQPR